MEIHRALEASGAMEPIIASISVGVVYEHPIKKEAKANMKNSLKKIIVTNEAQHKITETEIAPALLHLSPSLPKYTPSSAVPRKVIDPKTPIWNSLKKYSSSRKVGIKGLAISMTNIIVAKNSDQIIIFFVLNEEDGDEGGVGWVVACWLLIRRITLAERTYRINAKRATHLIPVIVKR